MKVKGCTIAELDLKNWCIRLFGHHGRSNNNAPQSPCMTAYFVVWCGRIIFDTRCRNKAGFLYADFYGETFVSLHLRSSLDTLIFAYSRSQEQEQNNNDE